MNQVVFWFLVIKLSTQDFKEFEYSTFVYRDLQSCIAEVNRASEMVGGKFNFACKLECVGGDVDVCKKQRKIFGW